MKKHITFACILALLLAACQKPDPGVDPNGNQPTDTTETIVKKYLVKEYYAEAPAQPVRVIEWNEDFTQIMHITTDSNTYYQVDYSFEYYGEDSMRVVLSTPTNSSAGLLFSEYLCHFDETGKISSIDYFLNSSYQQTESYCYDLSGKLESVVDEAHNCGIRFVWDGDNVCETCDVQTGETERRFGDFSEHLHPDCTMPYLLPDGNTYNFWYLTEPLWKNWYNYAANMQYEYDEDGFVICSYCLDEQGEKTAIKKYDYAKQPIFKNKLR